MDAPATPHLPPRSFIDNSELRSILSNLSQELARPVISLRMRFDGLLADAARPVSDDQGAHLRTMVSVCNEMLRLSSSYLDHAGLVQATRPFSLTNFSVGALLREIDHRFSPTAAARNVSWVTRLDGPDRTVSTDASRCQLIFGSLIDNALGFTHEGGQVQVVARADRTHWVVTVADNGRGIPADALARVFEPFYKVPNEGDLRPAGNGLGLAVCRELVAQLGGEIGVHSGEGPGTRFTVRLPVTPPTPIA